MRPHYFSFVSALVLVASGIPAQQPAPAPAPEPIKPASIVPPATPKAKQPTTIDCDSVDMDLKNSVFTYTNNVVVNGPQFHLTTDGTFTVYMRKEKKPKAKDAAATASNSAQQPETALSDQPGDANNLDHATAVGKEVVIVKTDAEGKSKIGKCRNAYYDGKTGDMILRDWPQVQDGENVIIAAEASTVMTLTKDGKFGVKGRTRTELAGSDKSKKSKGDASSNAPASGGGISIPTPAPRRQQ
ncbi:MAG: hypothetical protein JNM99_14150 [Verrucomicrobiaceae bacterium]|nr:hypothetical protein [Verrucomicrobiaceae bacterium]